MHCLTPAQVAAQWSCSTDHVLDLIRGNHLKGVRISPPGSKRPRYRVTQQALAEYESRNQSGAPAKPLRRSRSQSPNVIEFYK